MEVRKEDSSGWEKKTGKLRGRRDELCAREEAIVRHARVSQRACVRKHWK